ncbi:PorT family protein [Bacteroidales bacterium OttesenSCG-928-B11]|nr:PorT family protein [Bacteroidales bacterium OttesenSCG-928-C03]MDL2311664.1 PorT family protein [Bacteroidales bacterium OttesenSCG-928-B11]MDL2325765.1 PorT family protein [Bacteroidales bacterium OttesenSCG-928-A14]
MKKFSFLLIITLISMTAFSQVSLGIKGGVNFSNSTDLNTSMKTGGDAGIFLRLGDPFYFQPEVNYSFRSSSFKNLLDVELPNNFDLKTHNLDIPLLFGYKFLDYENFNFRVFIGPRIGVMLDNNFNKETHHDYFTLMEYGGQFGIGIDFWRFTLDFKYDFSTKKYEPILLDEQWLKQNMFNISIGFKFIK